ncbi:cupin domain-containing protein [Streptomyces verrucosisporus]|uniref:cupin domain-containing protein n=1 Tax=Streptomyces verrucosisporus TaxID=1695161 RepID=UPI0019D0F97A|nr:cupin domain-containing protein [Streptomyces verrucosisporus]MBN3932253.1 cupin domain-containing protein [Streptomyces verrucosisporus]
MSPDETPRVLTDLDDRIARAAPGEGGALWRLAESGRQLDANLVRLPPGASVGEHAENDLDVLLLVVAGGGEMEDGSGGRRALAPKALVWLPRTSRRALRAGPEGLVYLTVHRRRPGMTVGVRPPSAERAAPGGDEDGGEGGEGPCMLDRVCPACGRMNERAGSGVCERCGEPLPSPRAA